MSSHESNIKSVMLIYCFIECKGLLIRNSV